MKKKDDLQSQILNLKHYNQVLRRKLQIYKDTVARNQKLIDKLIQENKRLRGDIDEH